MRRMWKEDMEGSGVGAGARGLLLSNAESIPLQSHPQMAALPRPGVWPRAFGTLKIFAL